jgi:hypothetical protein
MRKLKLKAGLCAFAFAVAFFASHADAQARQARGWRRIVPMRSTRAEVLRRLGKPRRGNATYSSYEFEGEQDVRVDYSDGKRCSAGAAWRVPRGTVLRILVRPTRVPALHLTDLHLDVRKFRKEEGSGDVQARTRYTDEAAGVTYEVYEHGGGPESGQVMSIEYGPTARDKRLRCPQTRAETSAVKEPKK